MKSKYDWIVDGLIISIITTILMMLFIMIYLMLIGFYDYLYYDEILILGVFLPIIASIKIFIPNCMGGLLSKYFDQRGTNLNHYIVGSFTAFALILTQILFLSFDLASGLEKIAEKINQAILFGSIDGVIFFITYLLVTRKSVKKKTEPEL